MPIVIDRKTGELLDAREPTTEQKQKAWEIIVKNYVEKHAEILQEQEETNENNEGPV